MGTFAGVVAAWLWHTVHRNRSTFLLCSGSQSRVIAHLKLNFCLKIRIANLHLNCAITKYILPRTSQASVHLGGVAQIAFFPISCYGYLITQAIWKVLDIRQTKNPNEIFSHGWYDFQHVPNHCRGVTLLPWCYSVVSFMCQRYPRSNPPPSKFCARCKHSHR